MARLKRILINRNIIDANRRNSQSDPPISVKTYKGTYYSDSVSILDKDGEVIATISYKPEDPLSCGATVWIETKELVSYAPAENPI